MMQSLPDPQTASRWCSQQRAHHKTIGYVPTMGALHNGHLSLVERAARENDIACVSIFVNPLQFNNRDDLQNYPRDMQQDISMLERAGCRMVYTGSLAGFFPEVADVSTIVPAGAGDAAHGLEGEFRPGHLQGVRAIVERLFSTVGVCNAYFGEKDFQQTLVVTELARQFDGVNVVVCPTVREPSGLAMSSRNQRLKPVQLEVAAKLYQALLAAKEAWRNGIRRRSELESMMREKLKDKHLQVEYAAVRDPENWSEDSPHGELTRARALIAAYLGEVRLIDNLRLDQ